MVDSAKALDDTEAGAGVVPASASVAVERAPLDDVMIAMDVVDTLRSDEHIVARELSEETRRAELIERLREIYRGQGIEVPDKILEDGVRALEEQRFVYKPPPDTIVSRLAKLYVGRLQWGQYALGALGAVAVLWLSWIVVVDWPKQRATMRLERELEQVLPERIKALRQQILAETDDRPVAAWTASTAVQGMSAASSRDVGQARAAVSRLEDMLAKLRAEYTIRVVTRKGEVSGFCRVPKVNPQARNHYLVVEAIGADNQPLPQAIENEETGKRETVTKWAVRVPRDVLERVRADKAADGIVNDPVVAVKRRGQPEPDWKVARDGGAITRW